MLPVNHIHNVLCLGSQIWLVIFPEGTRFDPQKSDKLERSQAYADSLGLPRLNHVLMPRTTGFEVGLCMVHQLM